jgi:hypothetical protein
LGQPRRKYRAVLNTITEGGTFQAGNSSKSHDCIAATALLDQLVRFDDGVSDLRAAMLRAIGRSQLVTVERRTPVVRRGL